MTREKAESLLTAEEIAQATTAGKAWGEAEVELWADQHDGAAPDRDWTLGTFCGDLPFDREDDRREAYELILDLSARDVWNEAREIANA